ncbi:MAG: hypothetical protein RL324_2428 [Verrucomicrobiota bacterium]
MKIAAAIALLGLSSLKLRADGTASMYNYDCGYAYASYFVLVYCNAGDTNFSMYGPVVSSAAGYSDFNAAKTGAESYVSAQGTGNAGYADGVDSGWVN